MSATSQSEADYAIIGGGVVGLSVAHGLLQIGKRVCIFDEGDNAFRASRGNFGLVWVQGKGLNDSRYARWSQKSAAAWAGHAETLREVTGIDAALRQDGGYDYHLDEAALHQRAADYTALKEQLDGDYPFEILGHNELRREEPHVGPEAVGAILHRQDGHVNPLRLFQSLAAAVKIQGGTVKPETPVTEVVPADGGYRLTSGGRIECAAEKVIIAAGLGAAKLAPGLGFQAPVRPQRGQVMITEKIPKLMHRPSGTLRQVDEGGIQIGASAEEVGPDNRETGDIAALMARDAIKLFPALGKTRILRHWAALRIMSPDGLPIYQESTRHAGIFLVTCHSGVTLSAAHALFLPQWLEGDPDMRLPDAFGEARFNV